MRYAYRQLLVEYPERFPDIRAKQDLAESVVELLEGIKSIAANDIGEVVALIMEDDEQ
jgi:hypothetical protein